jgi:hypothetical protein
MTGEIVVDASLALKWVLEAPYSAEANELLENWGEQRNKLLAPALFLYEVVNALAKRIQRQRLTLAQAKERLGCFLESGRFSGKSGLFIRAPSNWQIDFDYPVHTTRTISPWRSSNDVNSGPPTNGCGIPSSVNFAGCTGSARAR